MPARINAAVSALARRLGWGSLLGFVVLLAFVSLRAWDPAGLQLVRLKTFDLYQIAKPRIAEARPVMIVDIDEASLDRLGQWPWPRSLIARLVDRVSDAGAAAIAFDIVFPEPDRTSPHLMADSISELSDSARDELARLDSHDTILAESLARARVVLGQSAFNPKPGEPRTRAGASTGIAAIGGDPKPHLVSFPELLPNIPELERAAAGRGMFTVRPDSDGVVRRAPLVLVARDMVVPSLSADLLRVASGQNSLLIKTGRGGVSSVVIAGVEIPTDRSGQLWVHFTPHERDRFVSAAEVIEGRGLDRLNGRLVLVGTSASGLLDLKTTPLGPSMPGVEVHAQMLENILTETALLRPGYMVGVELSLTVLIGIAIALAVPVLGAVTVLALGLAVSAALIGGAWYLFVSHHLLVDAGFPLLSSFAVLAVMVSTNYLREEAQRRHIRSAFSQYLSADLVEQVARHPERLVLGGEAREMTILFSDVRGFTAISESYKDNPQALTELMNQLLTPLSHAIIENRGTIDKYIGDAIMAFWNAPLDDRDHAVNACRAALEMDRRLAQLNLQRETEARQAGQSFVPLRVGIGINTGDCVVGNMGSDLRFDYSVLGDSVNLASRLEGQTRAYGLSIIIGSRTAELAGDAFAMVELDSIRVKGKREPETIFALLGSADMAAEPEFQALRDRVDQARRAFRQQDWNGVAEAFAACRTGANGINLEPLCDLYENRIAVLRHSPPPPDWDGIVTLGSK